MTVERNWRDAKIPKWARQAMKAEVDAFRFIAALSWPIKARPEPLPFRWVQYYQLEGEPVPGNYWAAMPFVREVRIVPNDDLDKSWRAWLFAYHGGQRLTHESPDGPLFATKRDAQLWNLWDECERAASKLMDLKAALETGEDA